MAEVRIEHTASVLSDGRVLVAGGWDLGFGLASAEVYDPSTGLWSLTGSMAEERSRHTATLLSDGTVLVAGGRGSEEEVTAAPAAPAPVTQEKETVTVTKEVVAVRYLTTRASAESYNPSTGTWASAGSMGHSREGHSTVLLGDGRVLVVGGNGYDARQPYSSTLAPPEIYDPSTETWVSP